MGVELPSWPEFFAADVTLARMVEGLARAERESAAARLLGQQRQLALLTRWAVANVPWYAAYGPAARQLARLSAAPEAFWNTWRSLPIVTKASLRSAGPQFYARGVPPAHRPLMLTHTSGSTGTPVSLRMTRLTQAVWEALSIREHQWQGRDFAKRLGIIRYRPAAERDPKGLRLPSWGVPVEKLFKSGPASLIHIGLPVDVLARWLVDFDPHYLLASPSVIAALLEACPAAPPALEEIRCAFEPLDLELEQRIARSWQVRCSDIYSANETGYLAFRCREGGTLHIQDESVVVEILDEAGRPCAAGMTGRVVVTPLHNLATPLLRYELGDYATLGVSCPCGRAGAVIARVRGRVRNLAQAPDGTRFWPVSLNRLGRFAAIRQVQFVQTARDCIEVHAVLARPLSAVEQADVRMAVCQVLGHAYQVDIIAVEAIARAASGKFEEFVSRLED